MTLPTERARALCLGCEFLWALRFAGNLTAVQYCMVDAWH